MNGNVCLGDAPSPVSLGTTSPPSSTPTYSMSTPSTPITTSLDLGSYCNNAPTRGELLASQAKSMIIIARMLETGSL